MIIAGRCPYDGRNIVFIFDDRRTFNYDPCYRFTIPGGNFGMAEPIRDHDPLNSSVVTLSSAVIPSCLKTFETVMKRIFRSSIGVQ